MSNPTSSEPSITSSYTNIFSSYYVVFPPEIEKKCDVIYLSSDDEVEEPDDATPENNLSHNKEPLIDNKKEATTDCATKPPFPDGKGINMEDLKAVGNVAYGPCKDNIPNDVRRSETTVVVIEDTSSSSGYFRSPQSSNSISNY